MVDFETILPTWTNKLWPGRVSPIKPQSSMTMGQGYNMRIYDDYRTWCWAIYCNDEIVAVNSGHQTSECDFRSRGLYVDPAHRGVGLANQLLEDIIICADALGMERVWTLPRKGSENVYVNAGFVLTGDWFDEGMEFGPNILAIKEIKKAP